jgi:hypothetical protein
MFPFALGGCFDIGYHQFRKFLAFQFVDINLLVSLKSKAFLQVVQDCAVRDLERLHN